MDDEEDNRALLCELLCLEVGCSVRTACHGLEAVAFLRQPEEPPPCLIVLDWMMPKMNGAQVLAELATDPVLAAIPVVVCSAAPHLEAPSAVAVMKKPFDMIALVALVREYCDRARTAPFSTAAAVSLLAVG